jgi:YebC/PmpR family DNA-binding regulatory protein
MSGHSKWSKIKRKKGANDAKRSKEFSRVIKEITVAAREGGTDIDSNARLRTAIANAKGVNMPKDNVERAIKKASDKNAADFHEISFEAYAQHGIAVYVECTTDNNQRSVANIRSYFNKYGCSLGKNGSLSFIFDRKGVFTILKGEIDQDEFEMELIDAGAEDIELEDDYFTVYTSLEDFGNMQKKLEQLNIEPEKAELQRIPNNTEKIEVEKAIKVLNLVEMIEDDDDVQNVFHNLEMTDELLEELEK